MDNETHSVLEHYVDSVSRVTGKVAEFLNKKDNEASRLAALVYIDMVQFCMEAITDILDEVDVRDE